MANHSAYPIFTCDALSGANWRRISPFVGFQVESFTHFSFITRMTSGADRYLSTLVDSFPSVHAHVWRLKSWCQSNRHLLTVVGVIVVTILVKVWQKQGIRHGDIDAQIQKIGRLRFLGAARSAQWSSKSSRKRRRYHRRHHYHCGRRLILCRTCCVLGGCRSRHWWKRERFVASKRMHRFVFVCFLLWMDGSSYESNQWYAGDVNNASTIHNNYCLLVESWERYR